MKSLLLFWLTYSFASALLLVLLGQHYIGARAFYIGSDSISFSNAHSPDFVPSSDCRNDSYTIHWQFINYHKTGYELSQFLLFSVVNYCNRKQLCVRVGLSSYNVNYPLQTDILVLHNPHPAELRWNESDKTLVNLAPSRTVHMIRNPYEMVMSAYLYHSRSVPNIREGFLTSKIFNPCQFAQYALDGYATELSWAIDRPYDVVENWIRGIIGVCIALREKYYKVRYFELLRNAVDGTDPYDGVRLEATRTMLQQILPMTLNVVREVKMAAHAAAQQQPQTAPLHITLDDFPVGDAATFNASARRVYEYLMPVVSKPVPLVYKPSATSTDGDNNSVAPVAPIASTGYPFYYCIGVEKAVEEFFKNAFLPNTNASIHVTKDEMSKLQREELIWRLRQDPHFGELFNMTEKLLFSSVEVEG